MDAPALPAIAQAEDGVALGELGRLATVTLNPQMIPLQVKVIIIGSRQLYYALQDADPDFQEMFRVLVDFDEDIPMVDESLEQFAQLLKTRTSEEGMAPLTSDAVARLATYSARLAEHQAACRRVLVICSSWSARRTSFATWRATR